MKDETRRNCWRQRNTSKNVAQWIRNSKTERLYRIRSSTSSPLHQKYPMDNRLCLPMTSLMEYESSSGLGGF